MKRYLVVTLMILILVLALTGCALPNPTAGTTSTPTPALKGAQPASSPGSTASSQATPVLSSNNQQQGSLYSSVSGLEMTLESIYNQVNPSVVNIQVVEKTQAPSSIFPGLLPTPGSPQYNSALGSGFIWDNEGHIVTNNHVVSGSSSISVTFSDGNTVPATVVGTDPDSDLAVIKVNATSQQLQPVTLADSNQLKVGQLAIAIGNPFGLQGTMTVGFISGLGRLVPTNENALGPTYSIPDIIQTDASINPGNSGGVLLDDTGKVIGVTQSIATTSGSS